MERTFVERGYMLKAHVAGGCDIYGLPATI
jgi:hypothetical protein